MNYDDIRNCQSRISLARELTTSVASALDTRAMFAQLLKAASRAEDIETMIKLIDNLIGGLNGQCAGLRQVSRAKPKRPDVMEVLAMDPRELPQLQLAHQADTDVGFALYAADKAIRRLENLKLKAEDAMFDLELAAAA